MFSRLALFALLLMGLPVSLPAHAQENWPTRPIRILLANAPGGPTDVYARTLGEAMTAAWGQNVIIEPRAGAGGQIASRELLKSKPDGYTLMIGNTGATAVAPVLYQNPGYDPTKDFTAISIVTRAAFFLVVRSDVPAKNVHELVALMKQDPSKVKFGSPGIGQSTHMAAELLRLLAGTGDKTIIVPTSGSTQIANTMLAGDVQAMFDSTVSVPLVESGQFRALAVAGPKRSRVFPDVPTIAETGLDPFNITSWYVLLAPAGTPQPIIDKLNKITVDTLSRADVKERFQKMNAEADPTSPEVAQKYLASELDNWRSIIKRAGIKAME
jgi:tripartite-type tricarboxylate transporter receptor subunit TctC